jgi:hypothetical protein
MHNLKELYTNIINTGISSFAICHVDRHYSLLNTNYGMLQLQVSWAQLIYVKAAALHHNNVNFKTYIPSIKPMK